MDDDAELPQEMAQRDEPATREKYGHDGPHTAVDHSNSFDCNPVGSIYCPYCPPYAAPQLLSLGAECGQPLAPVLIAGPFACWRRFTSGGRCSWLILRGDKGNKEKGNDGGCH